MAALPAAEIDKAHVEVVDAWGQRREVIGDVSKVQLRAAFVAMDNWLDGQAAALNAALPAAARTGLTARQKAEVFYAVMRQRFRQL